MLWRYLCISIALALPIIHAKDAKFLEIPEVSVSRGSLVVGSSTTGSYQWCLKRCSAMSYKNCAGFELNKKTKRCNLYQSVDYFKDANGTEIYKRIMPCNSHTSIRQEIVVALPENETKHRWMCLPCPQGKQPDQSGKHCVTPPEATGRALYPKPPLPNWLPRASDAVLKFDLPQTTLPVASAPRPTLFINQPAQQVLPNSPPIPMEEWHTPATAHPAIPTIRKASRARCGLAKYGQARWEEPEEVEEPREDSVSEIILINDCGGRHCIFNKHQPKFDHELLTPPSRSATFNRPITLSDIEKPNLPNQPSTTEEGSEDEGDECSR